MRVKNHYTRSLIMGVLFTLYSCSNDKEERRPAALSAEVQQVLHNRYQGMNNTEKMLLDRLELIALIMAELLAEPHLIQEVAQVLEKSQHETMPFAQLLDEKNGARAFASRFYEVLHSGAYLEYPQRTGHSQDLPLPDAIGLIEFLVQERVQLYCPHYRQYDGQQLPLVSFRHGRSPEKGIGYLRREEMDGRVRYETLVLGEEERKRYLVWIVQIDKQ